MTLGIEVWLLGSASLLLDGCPDPLPGARQRVALAALDDLRSESLVLGHPLTADIRGRVRTLTAGRRHPTARG